MALTDAKIRAAKPQDKPYKLADSGNMFLLVHPNGTRSVTLLNYFQYPAQRSTGLSTASRIKFCLIKIKYKRLFMILYKYMSYENFEKFLGSGCIVFSSVDSFNDISEMINYFSSGLQDENISEFENWLNSYCNISKSVILCLTRNPLNTLMRSHYANSHKGVVIGIGIDISKTDMTIFEDNISPIQLGSVIYTKTHPSNKVFLTNNIANLQTQSIGFNLENIEILQRLYLYKSIDWSYEEEVRVVKNRNYSKFKRQDFYESHKFMELPLNSVVEVYFGVSHIDKVNVKTYELLKEKYKDISNGAVNSHSN